MKPVSLSRKRGQRGQAIMEFGLCFLVFFFLLYGIMEFGRMVASYNILAGATREGARYAVVHGSSSGSAATATDVQTVVRKWSVGLDTSSITVTASGVGGAPGSTVTVKSTYSMLPFTSLFLTNNVSLTSSSVMVISQ
jgi:Flp pilus assembly protein TadG